MRTLSTLVFLSVICFTKSSIFASDLDQTAAELRQKASIPALAISEFQCAQRDIAVQGVLRNDQLTIAPAAAKFNIGSNAKSMLAMAAANLQAKGVLRLHDTLEVLWPEGAAIAPEKKDITLAQLFNHSSGLPAFDKGAELDRVPLPDGKAISPTEETARWFLSQPLSAIPGTETRYSNAGYVVAGAILEQVTGKGVSHVLKQEVFTPLMLDAAMGEPRKLGPLEPFGHYQKGEDIIVYEEEEAPLPAFLQAAGNVAISIDDYVTYLQAHLCGLEGRTDGQFSAEFVKELHSTLLEDGAGLGWGLADIEGEKVSFHVGGTGDFTSFVLLMPARGLGVAALANIGGPAVATLQAWVFDHLKK